jgi:uncharacterized protein YdbL (DUF1318 family)
MTTLFRFIVSLATLSVLAVSLQAQDLGSVQARMRERLPKIDALKSEGALGENNRGFLEVRENKGDAASVSSAENSDRTTVYAAIAKQTGSTPAAVGAARAKQIANNSARGVWLQRENGEWYRK